jgi:hypothetical protein
MGTCGSSNVSKVDSKRRITIENNGNVHCHPQKGIQCVPCFRGQHCEKCPQGQASAQDGHIVQAPDSRISDSTAIGQHDQEHKNQQPQTNTPGVPLLQPLQHHTPNKDGIIPQPLPSTSQAPQPKDGRKHYKAVVVGKSGAGKSTFINMVANLYNKRRYNDERLVAITQGFNLQAEDGGEIQKVVMKCNMPKFKLTYRPMMSRLDRRSRRLRSVASTPLILESTCSLWLILLE